MAASLLALGGAGVLLVADSANTCETYDAFELQYDYELVCDDEEGDSGTLWMTRTSEDAPEGFQIEIDGDLRAEPVDVRYNRASCSGSSGHGVLRELSFFADGGSASFLCTHRLSGGVDAGDEPAASCELDLRGILPDAGPAGGSDAGRSGGSDGGAFARSPTAGSARPTTRHCSLSLTVVE